MNKFQLIVVIVILGLVTVAALVFAGVIPGLKTGGGGGKVASLTMWGSLSAEDITPVINKINEENKKTFSINYTQKKEATYGDELLNALASGTGPDLWVLSQDLILQNRKKVYLIPFTMFSERLFKDTFIDEAELFLWKDETSSGIVAVPFAVDPIVLFWNRSLFNKAGLSSPPRFWDEFLSFSQLMTEKDIDGRLLQSGSAMGEFNNIKNAKDIFSLLVLQSGNNIVDPQNLFLNFGAMGDAPLEPAGNALDFFTGFSNPSKLAYSWNRALPEAQDNFVAGKLAMYLGFASEFKTILEKNPHLNFDVALAPTVKDSPVQLTFGKMYALAVTKSSANLNGAIGAAFKLAQSDGFLVPVARGLLGQVSLNPATSVFYKAGLQSSAWLEPSPSAVRDIFAEMVNSVATGRKRISSAVSDAKALLQSELEKVLGKN